MFSGWEEVENLEDEEDEEAAATAGWIASNFNSRDGMPAYQEGLEEGSPTLMGLLLTKTIRDPENLGTFWSGARSGTE
jgi:hypothetical protein